MIDKIFLDTNIIVYAYDTSAGEKHERAKRLLLDLWDSGAGVISVQVLQEFYVTVTQKIPKPLDRDAALEIIKDLLSWEVVINDGGDTIEAISIQRKHRYSFWDALIVAAAAKTACSSLLSEDLPAGKVKGIQIANPFR